MTLRDDLLPTLDELRGLPQSFGLRRFAVTLRRRIWSGTYPGDGSITNVDLVISPLPRVRQNFSLRGLSPAALEYILQNGNVISDRLYMVDKFTPAFSANGVSGGWLSEQLRMRPSPDTKNVEPVVILVGDDGYARDCVQMTLEQDRAFGYTMLVKESDRPRAALASLAVATISGPAVVGDELLQLVSTGTFADGMTSALTALCKWVSSDSTKVKVDLLGRCSAVGSSGSTATITASLGGASTNIVVTVA
jgi:hypothetical protein